MNQKLLLWKLIGCNESANNHGSITIDDLYVEVARFDIKVENKRTREQWFMMD